MPKFKLITIVPKYPKSSTISYAGGIDCYRFPYFCAGSGEMVESLWELIRVSVRDLFLHGVLHRWKRSRFWQ